MVKLGIYNKTRISVKLEEKENKFNIIKTC